MITEVENAQQGIITEKMRNVAKTEGVSPEYIMEQVKEGHIIIVTGSERRKSVAIGKGLRTKVNASIGTSSDIVNLDMEIEKAQIAEQYGADTLMELSTGGDMDLIRREVLKSVDIPVGNVPLYQAAIESIEKYGAVVKMDPDFLFDTIEKQCEDGIGFMAIHCGVNQITIERLKNQGYRHGGLVSRGGAFMTAWMAHNEKENPLYERFDELVEIMKKYDTVLSLGNGMRAGAIGDSTDKAQIQELVINAELAEIARKSGAQVMLEGPGHIPIDEIEANVILQKSLSNGAPFYMLGPIVTDVAAGYDHVAAAIGASLSSAYGADFICYVTPSEHLSLPFPEDVKEGVIYARIATHVGDMIKLNRRNRDLKVAEARRERDWDAQFRLFIEPEKGRKILRKAAPKEQKTCTMCGEHCALKIANRYFKELEPCR